MDQPLEPAGAAACVLIVDDHPVVIEGIAHLVEQAPGLRVCATVSTPDEARRAASACRPDVALIDLAPGAPNALDLIDEFANTIGCPVAVYSLLDDEQWRAAALGRGAAAFISKRSGTGQVVDTLLALARSRVMAG